MGNNDVPKIVGIRAMWLQIKNGTRFLLINAKHVPNLSLNMISISKLDDEGYFNIIGDRKWKLTKWSITVARGRK